ncbi:MAG: CinA family protein, partial [Pseudomonadales bacterium]
KAITAMPTYVDQVKSILGTAVVSDSFPSIAEATHTLLQASGKNLSIAESCTGGLLTSQLVEFPDSSDYLQQGLVTYANEAKEKILGVSQATLEKYGAVSLETAIEMAVGARTSLDSDLALSTTGIAGPDGGTDEKQAGMVVIALCDSTTCWVQAIKLTNRNRNLVRVMSCAVALDMLRRHLLNETPIVN